MPTLRSSGPARHVIPPKAHEQHDSDNPPSESGARETFLSALETLETAPLPSRSAYRIIATVPSACSDSDTAVSRNEPSLADLQRYRVQGEEALSDAIRPGPIFSTALADASGRGQLPKDGDVVGSNSVSGIRPDEGVVWASWVGEGAKRRRLVDHQGHPVARRRRPGGGGSGSGVDRVDDGIVGQGEESVVRKAPMWYAVPLRHPCTCQLARHLHAYTPLHPPPRTNALYLDAVLGDAEDPWIAEDRDDLLDWRADEDGTEEVEEDVPPFESSWRDAGGLSGNYRHSSDDGARKGARQEVHGETGRTVSSSMGDATSHIQKRHTRSALLPDLTDPRKAGLGVVQEPPDQGLREVSLPQAAPRPERAGDLLIRPSQAVVHSMTRGFRAEEAKRRKRLWRGMMALDEGYGQMWDIIPLPHVRSAKYLAPRSSPHVDVPEAAKSRAAVKGVITSTARPPGPPARAYSGSTIPPPPFILPRALTQQQTSTSSSPSHPFHPDLPRYIAKYGSARVYWVIPINGPVIVPGLNDHDLTSSTSTTGGASDPKGADAPSRYPLCPSTAILRDVDDLPHVDPLTRPFPLLWTQATLRQFWTKLCALQDDVGERDTVGAHGREQGQEKGMEKWCGRMFAGISVMLSGPKPDPFIDLPPPSDKCGEATDAKGDAALAEVREGLKRHRGVKATPSGGVQCKVGPRGTTDTDIARPSGNADNSAIATPLPLNSNVQPVEPECGDHIRIYLDARHALSFRSWLHAIQLDAVDTLFSGRDLAAGDAGVVPDDERGSRWAPTGVIAVGQGVPSVKRSHRASSLTDPDADSRAGQVKRRPRNLVPMSSTVQPEPYDAGNEKGDEEEGAEDGVGKAAEARGEEAGKYNRVKVRQFNKVRLALVGDRGEVLVVA